MNAIYNAIGRIVTAFVFGPLDHTLCRLTHRHP